MMNALKNQANSAISKSAAQLSPQKGAETALTNGMAVAKAPLNGEQQLQKQATNLIGQTFFGTLLKQMRDSPFKSDLFSGGRGGQAFSEMYDQHIAMHMAQRSGAKLTRPIVKKFKAQATEAYERNQKFQKEHSNVPDNIRA